MSNKYAFLHIPKTGGTFLKGATILLDYPITFTADHIDYETYREVHRPQEDQSYITIVRNPIHWYKSFWRYRMKTGWGGDPAIGHGEYAIDNFVEFVRKVTSDYPGYLDELYSRYTKPGVVVLRQFELVESLVKLFGDTRVRELPWANVSTIPCEHTRETIALIRRSERRTFRRYGYEPDQPQPLRLPTVA